MTTTKLNDLFDQLEPEKGNILDDKIKLEEIDLDFDHLVHIAKNVHFSNYGETSVDYFHKNITKTYTSKQITKFSTMLTNELVYAIGYIRTGELICSLVNGSKDSTHLIFTKHLNEKLDFLGDYLENKTLHIQGDAGAYLGHKMIESTIFVDGNAGAQAGDDMKSGKITINGNCSCYTGRNMLGGKIIIKGNTGEILGYGMDGGTIEVHGDIESLSEDIEGGNIYHKGKQIVKSGQLLDDSYKLE